MKTSLCSILLLVATATLSFAQNLYAGQQSLALVQPTPPPYCKPCLFYGGDFDPTNPDANGIENDKVLTWGLMPNAVYVPFIVPSGQQWTVGGLFVNVLSQNTAIDPPLAVYSISTGVSTGNAGTTLLTRTAQATYVPTGRSWNGLTEYTVKVHVRPVTLQADTYWLSVLPWCSNPGDSQCVSAAYYISDVEDNPPPHHKGSEPGNDSFFSGSLGNEYFVPTWGPNGQCGGLGCNRFSAGVIGTVQATSD
jgi:hypothetical protein